MSRRRSWRRRIHVSATKWAVSPPGAILRLRTHYVLCIVLWSRRVSPKRAIVQSSRLHRAPYSRDKAPQRVMMDLGMYSVQCARSDKKIESVGWLIDVFCW